MFSFPITATLPAFAMMATLLAVGGHGALALGLPEPLWLVLMLAGIELTHAAMQRFDAASPGRDTQKEERC